MECAALNPPAVLISVSASLAPWLEFFTFRDINLRLILAGCVLLGISAGVLGCFAFLRKRSLLGDALAHSALPGVCAAFMLTGTKDPVIILIGATVSCWVGAISIDLITKHTRVKEESALGMVLSVFFGAGILMLTHIQRSGNASQAGLDKFLFGQASSMLDRDVWTLAIVGTIMLCAVALAYKEFKLISFDAEFGTALGLPTRMLEIALSTLIVLAVAIGLQAVGVVLMAAMLVTPAAAARYWTDHLGNMLLLSGFFGAISGAIGTYISYLGPRMPTGPWMVVAVTIVFLMSLLVAPKRGIIARVLLLRRIRRKTAEENILRTLYVTGEKEQRMDAPSSVAELQQFRTMNPWILDRTLDRLMDRGLVNETREGFFALTSDGIARGARLTRLHRLWELYLTRKLELAPDHVHDDAEEIEHIITPELEALLVAALDDPAVDPHAKKIPPAMDRESAIS
ncbi:MAG: iron chelate uptake ABC transporter family permease subunit [Candidatus Hydrogenedentes bacterium]|nr:iron chelate uptake ABC transporter family permease subunit [Candidatus Hydrogenedentota bacterium]